MGRWSAEAYNGLTSPEFLLAVLTIHSSRQPVDHFRHWLQSPLNGSRPRVVELVCGAASRMFDEWETLVFDDPEQSGTWAHIHSIDDDQRREAWTRHAILLCLSDAIDYGRRVLWPCRTFPLLIMWLIHQPPGVVCHERQNMASDLLNWSDEQINCASTIKIRNLFRRHIQRASRAGTLDEDMWSFINDIAQQWPLDTQSLEGTNNIAKLIIKLAPAIYWKRFSNRLTTSTCIPRSSYEQK